MVKLAKKKPKSTMAGRSKKKPEKREVHYPEPKTFMRDETNPITPGFAKELLGWEEEGEKKFKDDFLLRDENGKKIRCHNNTTNRPLMPMVYKTLKQEILRQRWQLNGEPVIIGKTGLILDNQHTLIGLVLAQQEKDNYAEKWPDCPKKITMKKVIVSGISEEDEVVNTINTGKSRTLADVFYRGGYFCDLKAGDRNVMSRIAQYAVQLLWDRTGAKQDAFNLRRTHTESLDFVERHSRLLDCVKHVFEENISGGLKESGLSPGYLAGMLYLMASGNSDPKKYFGVNDPTEKSLIWDQWEKACDFVVLIAGNAVEVRPLRLAISRKKEEYGISLAESLGILCQGWNLYSQGKSITDKSVKLRYHVDEDEISHMLDNPTVGGIDLGSIKDPYTPESEIGPDEVEKRKAEIDAKRKPR
jgi:hypothetical protein